MPLGSDDGWVLSRSLGSVSPGTALSPYVHDGGRSRRACPYSVLRPEQSLPPTQLSHRVHKHVRRPLKPLNAGPDADAQCDAPPINNRRGPGTSDMRSAHRADDSAAAILHYLAPTSCEQRMQTILVVDDMPIFREPMQAALASAGFSVMSAATGAEALSLMSERAPDVVVLDLGMPGLDGIAVLTRMREDPRLRTTPVIILTATADRDRVVRAAKLGIAGYILKSKFSLKELLDRIRSLLASPGAAPHETREAPASTASNARAPASPPALRRESRASEPAPVQSINALKPILTRQDLLDRMRACEEIKGFSPTVSQVLTMTATDRCSLDQVSKAISHDQAMALKILKVANSSVYSRGDRVDSVHKAVLRIGMESIRQAVLNIGVVERFGSPAFNSAISTQQFWEHSTACGIIAAEIAHELGAKDADTAFATGLLHDLGRVILAETLGLDYVRVIEAARSLQAPLELIESRMLLLNHADVMDRVLLAWKFPKHLVDPIMFHHLSVGGVRKVAPNRAAEVLRLGLANRLAHAMLLGDSGNGTIYSTDEHCRALGVTPEMLARIEEVARVQTDETKVALLAASHTGVWPRRAEELRAMFRVPFRPLFVSAEPALDGFRLFCTSLSGQVGDEPPNVVVASVAGTKERDVIPGMIDAAEQNAGVKGLPLIVLSPAGRVALSDEHLAKRSHVPLATPLSIAAFISVVNELTAGASQRAAA
jgi:HD-like signal output (HDOD) protein/CheY-like chemotaxis protein